MSPGEIYKIALWIKHGVHALPANREQCVVLSGRVDEFVKALKRLDEGGVSSNQVEAVESLFKKIQLYIEKLQSLTLIERFLRHNEIAHRLDGFNSDLTLLATDLNVALAIDDRLDRQAREADAADLNAKLETLLANDNLLLNALNIRTNEIREALEALARKMEQLGSNHAGGEATEAKFARAAYTTLLRVSGSQDTPVEEWRMTHFDIEKGEVIARGGFSTVYKGVMDGHTDVAIKELVDGDVDRGKFEHEVRVWYSLRHPNILPILGAGVSSKQPFMVCPYMPNGTLRQYIKTHPQSSLRLLYEAAQAITFMHKKGIVHGDLKSDNMLVDGAGHVQLTDFGFAAIRAHSNSKSYKSYQDGPGTMRWAAPERLQGGKLTTASDVYSFGMVVWETMSGGEVPWEHVVDNAAFRALVLDGKRPERPRGSDSGVWALAERMWQAEPGCRPGMAEVTVALGQAVGRGAERTGMALQGGKLAASDSGYAGSAGLASSDATTKDDGTADIPVSVSVSVPEESHELANRSPATQPLRIPAPSTTTTPSPPIQKMCNTCWGTGTVTSCYTRGLLGLALLPCRHGPDGTMNNGLLVWIAALPVAAGMLVLAPVLVVGRVLVNGGGNVCVHCSGTAVCPRVGGCGECKGPVENVRKG
ncbi:kinase-like domain-containing protein [Fimicolochytrium jonesii]|uniref:kinase-like domain-containing protein n=1 Tax=Fimicolochytrium jonesii TaxID=1396493 RepID=UPI0022FDC3E2|nr:kinase-like domain-containing protein [Fimicolochytrium jonesii]KAI8819474.1 kinase-like domain-containing protein [Fimicolochytrium jonesii]